MTEQAPLQLKIDARAALRLIDDASRTGTFIPVLGFESSCLASYNTTPRNARQVFGSLSAQLRELARQGARIRSVTTLLGRNEHAVKYFRKFRHRLVGDVEEYEPTEDHHLSRLIKNVAALACELTRTWSWAYANSPSPLGSSSSETEIDPSVTDRPDAIQAIKRSLDCCVQAWRKKEIEGREPNSLHIDWVYEKLLFLASQIFDPTQLWSEEDFPEPNPCTKRCCREAGEVDFRDRHWPFISDRKEQTNWEGPKLGGPFRLYRPLSSEAGIRLSHLVWLQGLLRHLLLCGTRAYRTREELAFLLSLDDTIPQLADIGADPFEVGLLYAGMPGEEKNLSEVLRYCEGSGPRPDDIEPEPRNPQPFYWALARFLKKERPKLAHSQYRAGRQVILSMCLDREMERALAREFTTFRVAFPVNKALSRVSTTSWVFAECESDRTGPGPGYRVRQFLNPSTSDDLLVHPGPLVIKMFGSPLEELPASRYDARGRVVEVYSHRLVLDETALLSSFDTFVPKEIDGFLLAGQFFFFGQNAIRWSERVPYSLSRTLEGSKQAGGRKRSVSIGETGTFGATALEKLEMHYTGDSVKPDEVINHFISKVAEND